MKKITLNVDNITTKQWTNFVLELNIMRKAWRPYGVDVKFLGHGINKIIDWGNKSYDSTKIDRRDSKSVQQDKESDLL